MTFKRRSPRPFSKANYGKTTQRRRGQPSGDGKKCHCHPTHFRTNIDEIIERASQAHKNAVMTTPFSAYLSIVLCQISSGRVARFLGRLTEDVVHFRFCVDKFVPFSVVEFSIFTGLRATVHLDWKPNDDIPYFRRCFPGISIRKLERTRILDTLWVLVERRDDVSVSDFARVYILFVFSCILFPTTNYYVPSSLIPYIEDLHKIDDYAWDQAVRKFLLRFISPRSKCKYIEGCVFGLMIWVYAHANSLGRRKSISGLPRFTRWSDPQTRPSKEKVDGDIEGLSPNVVTHPIVLDEEKFANYVVLPERLGIANEDEGADVGSGDESEAGLAEGYESEAGLGDGDESEAGWVDGDESEAGLGDGDESEAGWLRETNLRRGWVMEKNMRRGWVNHISPRRRMKVNPISPPLIGCREPRSRLLRGNEGRR